MAISTLQQALGGINSQVSESVAKVGLFNVIIYHFTGRVFNVFMDKMVFLLQSLHVRIIWAALMTFLGVWLVLTVKGW